MQTVGAFAVDGWLQNQLLHAGVFWHITQFLFNYDYTLVESGVEISDETNQQVTLKSSSPSHSLFSPFSCLLSLLLSSLTLSPTPSLPFPLLSSPLYILLLPSSFFSPISIAAKFEMLKYLFFFQINSFDT